MKDLTVVMPVYNEAACIGGVVQSWLDMLDRQGIAFTLLLLNDGSKDGTAERLESLSGDSRIRVVHKPNEGHGPTILRGYRMACADSEWVFQVDSDDEIRAESFPALWTIRSRYDVVLGEREGRHETFGRRVLSGGSRLMVRLLCGKGVSDVNVPYRLMRSSRLAPLLDRIPPDMFAPNVVLAGMAVRRRLALATVAVQNRDRQTGQSSLMSWRLIQVACRSLWQVGAALLRERINP